MLLACDISAALFDYRFVALRTKAYAFPMTKKSKSVVRMKLIALLMYVADQKQRNLATMEQLFSRLRLPRKD